MTTINLNDIAKGLDKKSSRNKLPEGKSEVLENLKPHVTGKVETRRGTRSHAGILPSAVPVRGAAVYRSELEEYPIAIADGKVYERAASTAATTIDIEADITADFSVGPAFYATSADNDTFRRTGGAIQGTNVSGNTVTIVSATYNETLSLASYVLFVEGRIFVNGALALADVVKTTSDTLADWITITQMGHSEYNGTFEITGISEVVVGADSTITVVVNNATGDDSTPDELDAGGWAEVATNVVETGNIQTLEAGDTLVGVYDSGESTLHAFNNTVSVREVSGNFASINMVEDEAATEIVVTASESYIDFVDDVGTQAAVLTVGSYTLNTLQAEMQTKCNAASTNTITCSYSATTGKYSFTSDGSTFQMPWTTGTNTVNSVGAIIGFTSDDTGALTYTGDTSRAAVVTGDRTIQGSRTATAWSVASISGFTNGNMMYTDALTRPMRSTAVSGTTITVDEAVEITHGDAITESYQWSAVTVPGGTGDLVPSAPTRILPESPTARVRTASMQDSVYIANGTDSLQKYDGTNVYRAGLPNWNPESRIYVNNELAGLVSDEFTYTSITPNERKITLPKGYSISIGDVLVHKELKRSFVVNEVDESSATVTDVIVGSKATQLPDESLTFANTDLRASFDCVIWADHGLQEDTALLYTEGSAALNDLTDGNTYYVNVWDKDHIRLKNSAGGTTVRDLVSTAATGAILATTYDKTFYLEKTHSYYYRLNAIDVSNNIVASVVSGYNDLVLDIQQSGAVVHCLNSLPILDQYDFDRVEVEVYRTKQNTIAPFYRIQTVVIPFNELNRELIIYDTVPDLSLGDGDLDSTMTSTKGAELLTSGSTNFSTKYIETAGSRLVAANIKSADTLDIVFNKTTSDTSVNTLADTVVNLTDGSSSKDFKFIDFFEQFTLGTNLSSITIATSGGDLEIRANPVTSSVYLSYIRDGNPFYATSGTELTTSTRYYMRNVDNDPTGTWVTFNASLTPTGDLVAYSAGTLTSIALGNVTGNLEEVSPATGAGSNTFTSNAGDLYVANSSANFEDGDRLIFIANSGAVLPTGISAEVIYTITNVSGTQAELLDPDGVTVPYVDAGSGSITSTVLTAFYINDSSLSSGDWIELRAMSKTLDSLTIPSFHFRDRGDAVYKDKRGVIHGHWKISSKTGNISKIKFEHNIEDPILSSSGDAGLWMAYSSSHVPVIVDADIFDKSRYNQQTNAYAVSDIFRGIQSLGRAINTYMNYETTPWAMAEFGSTIGTSVVKVTSATMGIDISTTVTQGDSSLFDVYINNTRQTSGSGQKRLYPSRVVLSYENFPEIFDDPFASDPSRSDSVVDINPADGQTITGMSTFFAESSTSASQVDDTLIVFKEASIFAVNVRTREFRQIASGGKGCTAPDSIAATPAGIMFANDFGIYMVNRSLQVEYVGEDLEELYETVNKSALSQAVGIIDPHDRIYKLAIPTGTSTVNNTMFCYSYEREGQGQRYGAWFVYTIANVSTMVASSQDLFMGTEDGDILQVRRDMDSDNGDFQDADVSAIDATLTLGSTDFGDPGIRKRLKRILGMFDMDETDLTDVLLETAINSEDLFRSSGTVTLKRTNDSSVAQQQAPTVGWSPEVRHCERIQIRITHGTRKEKLVLSGIAFQVTPLSDRGFRSNSNGDT